MSKPKLSVVIPSYCCVDSLKLSLAALKNQKGRVSYEIIIVDSSPGVELDILAAFNERVRTIKLPERTLPGMARNIGVEKAEGEIIVFLDADVLLAPDALTNIVAHYDSGAKIFGGALELSEYSTSGIAPVLEHYFYNHESQEARPDSVRKNLSSALLVMDRSLFFSSGGFKNIPRMQDTELTERLRREGQTLHFFSDIVGFQIQDSSLAKVLRKIFINGNNVYTIRYQSHCSIWQRGAFALLLPAIALGKAARINVRNLCFNRNKVLTLVSWPLIHLAAFLWMAGFYNSLFSSKGLSEER